MEPTISTVTLLVDSVLSGVKNSIFSRFLQVYTATENSLCLLFYDNAADMFSKYDNVRAANQFSNRVCGAMHIHCNQTVLFLTIS